MGLFDKKKTTKDDSIELVGLDVQFVSGVGQPATDERFLLYKDVTGQPLATEEVPVEKKRAVDEHEHENSGEDEPPVDPDDKSDGKKKYAWAACLRDNANESDPAAVCATLARAASGNKAEKADLTGQDIWLPGDADLVSMIMEARKEARMTEAVHEEVQKDNFIQAFARTLAEAAGLKLADATMAEATESLKQIAEKAAGKAPADDLGGGTPKYAANANKVPVVSHVTGQAPSDDKTKGGPIKSKAEKVFEGEVTQQPEIVLGGVAANTGNVGDNIVLGTPLYKSTVDAFLSKLESVAPNQAAVQQAKAALSAAFEAPEQETVEEPELPAVNEDMIKSWVMSGMEPVFSAVEAATAALEALRTDVDGLKANKSADPDVVALAARMDDIEETLSGIEGRLVNKSEVRPTQKSRVPVTASAPARRDAGVWSDSPFDIAAQIG